jgi:hypothetical protein
MKQGTNDLSYQELDVVKRAQAILEMDKIVKNMLEIPLNTYWIDRVVLECIINIIDPVLGKNGSIRHLSNRYNKVTRNQCKNYIINVKS